MTTEPSARSFGDIDEEFGDVGAGEAEEVKKDKKAKDLRDDDDDDDDNDDKNGGNNNDNNRGGGGQGQPELNSCVIYGSLLFLVGSAITIIALLATSFRRVDSTEYGLKDNTLSKQLDGEAKTAGLHAGTPGFEFIYFPSTYLTVDLPPDTCVSEDGLRVQFRVTFQYRIPQDWVRPAVIKYFNAPTWSRVVEAAGKSAVQHTCSEFEVSAFQNRRGVIQSTMESNLRTKLEGPDGDGEGGVYARAVSLQLQYLELPDEYKVSVQEKQAAAEDIELAKNQRIQEVTKAETELLKAREQSRLILDTAANDANVTLARATLEAEQQTFAFETEARVLVRARDTLNLTADGLLAFMTNRMFETVSDLKVAAGEPASLSRKNQL